MKVKAFAQVLEEEVDNGQYIGINLWLGAIFGMLINIYFKMKG